MKVTIGTAIALVVAMSFASAEKAEKSPFKRNHEALQRAEKRGDVEPRTRPDRFINETERRQMQRLESDPTNK